MKPLSAAELSIRPVGGAGAAVSFAKQQQARMEWRERIPGILVAGLVIALVYLYWSA